MQMEIEFKKLNMQTDFVNKVEPLYYTGKLWLGILCVLLTCNWLFVIVFNIFDYYFNSSGIVTTKDGTVAK